MSFLVDWVEKWRANSCLRGGSISYQGRLCSTKKDTISGWLQGKLKANPFWGRNPETHFCARRPLSALQRELRLRAEAAAQRPFAAVEAAAGHLLRPPLAPPGRQPGQRGQLPHGGGVPLPGRTGRAKGHFSLGFVFGMGYVVVFGKHVNIFAGGLVVETPT